MKKTTVILAAMAFAHSFSAPTYFSFTGKISFIPTDVGGYAAAHNIKAGNTVTYVLAVDTSRLAYTKSNGKVDVQTDSVNLSSGYHADYFFDSLIVPSLFSAAVKDTTSGSYLGYRTISKLGDASRYSLSFQTTIGSPNNGTQILFYIPDTGAVNYMPKVGDVIPVTEMYNDSSTASSSASMSLTLTAVSDTKPSMGIQYFNGAGSSWLNAETHEGVLLLQNHSGKVAVATIATLSGKILRSQSIGNQGAIPLSALPQGILFLRVIASGQTEFSKLTIAK